MALPLFEAVKPMAGVPYAHLFLVHLLSNVSRYDLSVAKGTALVLPTVKNHGCVSCILPKGLRAGGNQGISGLLRTFKLEWAQFSAQCCWGKRKWCHKSGRV